MSRFYLILTFIFLFKLSSEQSIKDTSLAIPMFRVSYSINFPFNDMALRYGLNSSVSFQFLHKTSSNFLIGYDITSLFGNKVKENVLENIRTTNGEIIGRLGHYTDILLSERGFYTGPQLGYLITTKSPNLNSGIYFLLSGGLLQHKIKIDNKNEDTPQVMGEYAKGYDRLTNGFALKESISYLFLSNKSIYNFYTGLEFYQGWTKSRRDFDYDLMKKDTKKRLDILIGFKLGWIIPFHKRVANSYYYY